MNEPIAPAVLGLDIGGANLKAATCSGITHTRPFPLWKHADRIAAQIREIRAEMPAHDLLAVTMTGELCDCFASKREGVLAILRSAEEAAAGTPLRVWTTRGELVEPARIRAEPLPAAAANWLAMAHLAARYTEGEPALLMDVGSTTTDLVYIDKGRPQPRAWTDPTRMAAGELVYTGLRRTPLCAVLGMGVAAEVFATMLDAYLIQRLVPENAADTQTADGRPATLDHAHARVARMWCADATEVPRADLEALARRAMETQATFVANAVAQVLYGRRTPRRVILAGSGEAIGWRVLATHTGLSRLPVISLADRLGPALSEAACAYAVATLAAEQRRKPIP
jgi:(4-(4-[2-(gamma-L-glutamylamino)ethyl]phenoxymethyl)furan-2-yl)methanamine synthase